MAITGLTGNTKKHLQLDAGAIYKNYDPATDTPATAATKLIGATVGGGTLAIVPEVRQISVDGVKGPTKGFETIDSWTATLTATIKEVNAKSVAMALGTVTEDTTTLDDYTILTINSNVSDSDYINNLTWVGTISGTTDPIMIMLKNVLCLNGFNFTVADKNEGNVPLVMTAHYDVTNLDEVPVKFYIPDVA